MESVNIVQPTKLFISKLVSAKKHFKKSMVNAPPNANKTNISKINSV